jgi:sortase A
MAVTATCPAHAYFKAPLDLRTGQWIAFCIHAPAITEMKILVRKTSLKLFLRWTQRLLFAGAAVILSYCIYVLADTWMFQGRETQVLERQLYDARQAKDQTPAGSPSSPVSAVTSSPLQVFKPDSLIGRIEIQRLGVSVVVVEGTGSRSLRRAVGHIRGTALPGESGNIGVAAHRDTFFRPLRNIRRDDIITLTTLGGEYRYRVVSTKITNPSDIAVLDSDGTEILTLVTCYPFYFVGSAPDRFIVRAERIL